MRKNISINVQSAACSTVALFASNSIIKVPAVRISLKSVSKRNSRTRRVQWSNATIWTRNCYDSSAGKKLKKKRKRTKEVFQLIDLSTFSPKSIWSQKTHLVPMMIWTRKKRKISKHSFNKKKYRMLCKSGSPGGNTGKSLLARRFKKLMILMQLNTIWTDLAKKNSLMTTS